MHDVRERPDCVQSLGAGPLVQGHRAPGRLGPDELTGPGLANPDVLRLARLVEMEEYPAYSARFPGERLCTVEIRLADGRVLKSGEKSPAWDGRFPPTDAELREKFRWIAGVFPEERVQYIEQLVWDAANLPEIIELQKVLSLAHSQKR